MIKKLLILFLLIKTINPIAQISLDWAVELDNNVANSNSSVNDIKVDQAGSVYVIGTFSGTVDFNPGPLTDIRTADWNDVYLQKYNSSGVLQWTRTFGGTSNDNGYRLELDASNNIYAVGQFGTTVDFDPGVGVASVTAAGSLDVFVLKLSSNGNFQWVKTFGGTQNELPYSFVRDLSGNLIITGYFNGTADFDPGAGTANRTAIANSDAYIVKLDVNGNFLWVATMGGIGTSNGREIAVDGSGNIYSVGTFTSTIDLDPGIGTTSITANTNATDMYIQKLNSSGTFQWAKTIGSASSSVQPYGITVQNGIMNIIASYNNTVDFDPGAGITEHTAVGSRDFVLMNFDTNCNYNWSHSTGGTGDDIPYGFFTNTSNEIFVTGVLFGSVDFDPGVGSNILNSNGSADIFCSKYNSSGNLVWADNIGGNNAEWGFTITVDANGSIYLAGNFNSTLIDFDPGPNEAFFSGSSIYESYILKLSECSSSSGIDVISACNSFTWIDGITYTSSNNTATYTIPNVAGCDSVVTLNLTINNSTTATVTETACDSYTWALNGTTYTTSGTYTHVGTNASGCPLTTTLNLTINNSTTATVTETACDSYTWALNGTTYTTSGTYTHVGTNASGCPLTTTLNLTINNSTTATVTETACDSYTWALNGTTYTTSGAYTHVGTNASGCALTTTLNLTINNSTTATVTETACDSYTWALNGTTYTTSGIYTHVGTNASGCPLTTTLNLTINFSSLSIQTETALDSYTWLINNQTYAESGSYTAVIPNSAGCDSTITLNLTLDFTGIGENKVNFMAFYPNPTSSFLTAEGEWIVNKEYALIDIQGRVVLNGTFKSNKETIDLNMLSRGQYLLSVESKEITVVKE